MNQILIKRRCLLLRVCLPGQPVMRPPLRVASCRVLAPEGALSRAPLALPFLGYRLSLSMMRAISSSFSSFSSGVPLSAAVRTQCSI